MCKMIVLLVNLFVKIIKFYRMWLKSEIEGLAKLYDNLDDENIAEFISTEALNAINNYGPLTLMNLRNYMLVPKHNRNPKTIRLTRLSETLDLKNWLEQIQSVISPSFPMRIEIGYSFLAQAKEEIIYVFCPKALASYSASLNSKTEYLNFLNEVKSIKEPQHLQNTFMSTTESGSPFTASGYKPLSLIANTIWITK